jgi:hypothetical protein
MVNAFGFPLSVSFHQCSALVVFILLLSEGQAGEDWEAPNKVVLYWKWLGGGEVHYKEDYFDIHLLSDTELSF